MGRFRQSLRAQWRAPRLSLQTQTSIRDLLVLQTWESIDRRDNPLTSGAVGYWSQGDEDGILERILARVLPNRTGKFLEFGVGDGRECNTIALLARGWRGAWIGGEELAFDVPSGSRLAFLHRWVDLDSLDAIATAAAEHVGAESDVVSMDLDGNDYHFVDRLLENGLRPRVWVVEYNAVFPPDVSWVMPYDASHSWNGTDDFFGGSFLSFVALFERYGYIPVATSIQGANLFFVRGDFSEVFADVPKDLTRIFSPARYELTAKRGHKPSARTVASLC
jgi:hypothetical protein